MSDEIAIIRIIRLAAVLLSISGFYQIADGAFAGGFLLSLGCGLLDVPGLLNWSFVNNFGQTRL